MKKCSLLGASVLMVVFIAACGNMNQEEGALETISDITSEAESDNSQDAASSFEGEDSDNEIVADKENLPEELEEGEVAAAITGSEGAGIEGDLSEAKVDLDYLRSENPDVCAYISVPGTNISGPVLKKNDSNDFYLEYNEQGEADSKGCICMDMGNEIDFTDPVTCLYGKTVEKGAFEELVNYLDAEYLKENQFIYVYTDDYAIEYKVFAAYSTSDTERLLVKHDFYDYAVYQQYINDVFTIRDMTAVLDEELKEQAIGSWNIVTLLGVDEDDSRMVLQAVYSGRAEN